MAQSEPVEVAVEIVDKFSGDLKELEAKLEKIDGKELRVDLDIDGSDIEEIKTRLKELEKTIDSKLDLDLSGYIKAKAAKDDLGRDIHSTLHIDTNKDNLGNLAGNAGFNPPPLQGFSDEERSVVNDFIINPDVARLHNKMDKGDRDGWVGPSNWRFGAGQKWGPKQAPYKPFGHQDTPFNVPHKMGGWGGYDNSGFGDVDFFGGIDGMMGKKGGSGEGGVFSKLTQKLAKFKPNIMMVWNFVAMLIPVLVTLAGAAVGAAAAMVGLATAGAAVVGLGLLGYGENAAESMDLLKRKLGEVKNELFSSLRPAFKAMNPIVDQWLDRLAPAAQKLVGPLTELAAYEGFLGNIGGGALDWFIGFLDVVGELRPEIEAVSAVIGQKLGGLNLMEWGVNEIHDNMGAVVGLMSIMASLIGIIYNVSKAIAFAIVPLKGLFKIVAAVARALSNRFVVGILSVVAAALTLAGAIYVLNFAMSNLTYTAIANATAYIFVLAQEILFLAASMIRTAASGIASMITGLYGMASAALSAIGVVGALNTVLATTAALIAATGIGALAMVTLGAIGGSMMSAGAGHGSASGMAGGGSSYGGYGGGGGGGGSTINIYGDVGNTEYQKMKDNFGSMYDEQSGIDDETEK